MDRAEADEQCSRNIFSISTIKLISCLYLTPAYKLNMENENDFLALIFSCFDVGYAGFITSSLRQMVRGGVEK